MYFCSTPFTHFNPFISTHVQSSPLALYEECSSQLMGQMRQWYAITESILSWEILSIWLKNGAWVNGHLPSHTSMVCHAGLK